ncbi:MAG: protein-disulfide reductase DsbD domain-containing protein [Pseudomonadota bacterium]
MNLAFARVFQCFGLVGLAIGIVSTDAWASRSQSTAWVEGHKSRVRLISGAQPTASGVALYTAVDMRMEKGWKTYWRHPGDAGGIPPTFDWSQSVNVRSATVVYPAPSRMVDEMGTAIGYKGTAIFPIRLVAADPNRPVIVRLKLFYGICKEICIPADVQLSLRLEPGQVTQMPVGIARALAAAPERVSLEDAKAGHGALKLVSVAPELNRSPPQLLVSVAGPKTSSALDLLAYPVKFMPVGVAKPLGKAGADGVRRFAIPIDTDDPAKLKGKELRLVMIGDGRAIETTWRMP